MQQANTGAFSASVSRVRWARLGRLAAIFVVSCLPLCAQVRVHFFGFGRTLTSLPATDRDPTTQALVEMLSSAQARSALEASALRFLRSTGANPNLPLLEVIEPDAPLGEAWQAKSAALAAVSFDANEVVVTRQYYPNGFSTYRLFVPLPLVIISSQTYSLIYSQPAWLDMRFDQQVDLSAAETKATVINQLSSLYDGDEFAEYHQRRLLESLDHASRSSSMDVTYGLRLTDVTILDTEEGDSRVYGDTAEVRRLLRSALECFWSRSELVIPSGPGTIDPELQRTLHVRGYGLEVSTIKDPSHRLPRHESGNVFIPIAIPEPDQWLHCEVKTVTKLLGKAAAGGSSDWAFVLKMKLSRTGDTDTPVLIGSGFPKLPDHPKASLRPHLMEALVVLTRDVSEGWRKLFEHQPVRIGN
ncbi:hypothetical protein [Actomonas aquatica]|uniref:Uncharacterized protein n=1 Tax=Actomonas aquatica TaxID=2866162 RepID=A0ABZ1C4U4_9BACT|nr:hypothetical protein [Opitutus sp. WL0086]WRQ86665.1 hypothetical protein K1X11_017775 [Opitutus sp. WL0086]